MPSCAAWSSATGTRAAYLDLSVMHDNEPAIALYEKLGFERVPVFAVKRKNAINERLFAGEHEGLDDLNPYARIVAEEALRRGVAVDVLDARAGEIRPATAGAALSPASRCPSSPPPWP